jgi:hypothetical protein
MVVGAHAVLLAFHLHLLPFQVERGLNEMLHRKRVKISVGIVPSVPESRLPDSYPDDERRFLWLSESTSAIRLLIKRHPYHLPSGLCGIINNFTSMFYCLRQRNAFRLWNIQVREVETGYRTSKPAIDRTFVQT